MKNSHIFKSFRVLHPTPTPQSPLLLISASDTLKLPLQFWQTLFKLFFVKGCLQFTHECTFHFLSFTGHFCSFFKVKFSQPWLFLNKIFCLSSSINKVIINDFKKKLTKKKISDYNEIKSRIELQNQSLARHLFTIYELKDPRCNCITMMVEIIVLLCDKQWLLLWQQKYVVQSLHSQWTKVQIYFANIVYGETCLLIEQWYLWHCQLGRVKLLRIFCSTNVAIANPSCSAIINIMHTSHLNNIANNLPCILCLLFSVALWTKL